MGEGCGRRACAVFVDGLDVVESTTPNLRRAPPSRPASEQVQDVGEKEGGATNPRGETVSHRRGTYDRLRAGGGSAYGPLCGTLWGVFWLFGGGFWSPHIYYIYYICALHRLYLPHVTPHACISCWDDAYIVQDIRPTFDYGCMSLASFVENYSRKDERTGWREKHLSHLSEIDR